jgi:hypothetical protein
MSDDEMEDALRRSPRKNADGQPVMAADAARNIIQNKKKIQGTKRDAPDKNTVGTKAPPKKKGKNTPEEDDANNFEPTLRTEGEKQKLAQEKKLVEPKRAHVKAITGKTNDGETTRDARRNNPDRLNAAAKKKHDQEVYDQQLNDEAKQAEILSPTASDANGDSNSDENAPTKKKTPSVHTASKKKPIPVRARKDQGSRNPLSRTSSMSSENASSVNDSPHSNLEGGGLTHHQTMTTKRQCSGPALSRPLTTLHPVNRVGHQYLSCTG